jgi:hypothetical protein
MAAAPVLSSPLFPRPLLARLFLWMPRPIQKPQHCQGPVANAGLLGFPRAGHVQSFDLVRAQEINQRLNFKTERIRIRYSLFSGVIDVQHRLPELVGKFQSQP